MDLWLDSPKRRQFKGIIFSPENEHNGYYNLWQGFGVEPEEGDYSLYENHIKEVICQNDPYIFNWVFDWMADAVQNPSEWPGSSIVLRGKQGTGKGVFANIFGDIFGNHFMPIFHQKGLTGRFNAHLKDKLMIFVDEGFWAGSRQDIGVLKSLVTEPILVVEMKYQDIIQMKNRVRIIMASNNEWVVPAGLDERRFCVLDISDNRKGDFPYFKAIGEQIKNGGLAALLHGLLGRKITSNLRKVPRTEALLDQIVNSMDSQYQWWFACLQEGSFYLNQYDDSPGWPKSMETVMIYSAYISFCNMGQKRYPIERSQFFKKLKTFCSSFKKFRKRISGIQTSIYSVPTLEECRTCFSELVNYDIEWQ